MPKSLKNLDHSKILDQIFLIRYRKFNPNKYDQAFYTYSAIAKSLNLNLNELNRLV